MSEEYESVESELEAGIEPETGRPRSKPGIGGRRSPDDGRLSDHVGSISPRAPETGVDRTGKKQSQWGPGSKRDSWYRKRDYS